MKKIYINQWNKANLIMGLVCFSLIFIIAVNYKALFIGIGAVFILFIYLMLVLSDPDVLEINSEGIYYQGADEVQRIFSWTHLIGIVHIKDERFFADDSDYILILSSSHYLKIDNFFNGYKDIVKDLKKIVGDKFIEDKDISLKEIDIDDYREKLINRVRISNMVHIQD